MTKPIYNAVVRHAGTRPCAVFVPSRRHARLLAADLLALAAAHRRPAAFLHAKPDLVQPFLKRIQDKVTFPLLPHLLFHSHVQLSHDRVQDMFNR